MTLKSLPRNTVVAYTLTSMREQEIQHENIKNHVHNIKYPSWHIQQGYGQLLLDAESENALRIEVTNRSTNYYGTERHPFHSTSLHALELEE